MQTALVTKYKTRNMTEGAMSWETVGRPPAMELVLVEDIRGELVSGSSVGEVW